MSHVRTEPLHARMKSVLAGLARAIACMEQCEWPDGPLIISGTDVWNAACDFAAARLGITDESCVPRLIEDDWVRGLLDVLDRTQRMKGGP